MQRHLGRALTSSIYPLIGFAGLIAASGCAAIPAINMASSLLKPAQPTQPAPAGTAAPSTDIFSTLAQRVGVTLPTAGSGAAQSQTGAASVDMPAATTTASK